MTIQTIFDRMSLYDNQLDLVAGGDDVLRGIIALNLAQDVWETYAAGFSSLCKSTSTFATTASQNYTTWPSGLKRVDSLWLLDSNGREVCELDKIDQEGGHVPNFSWPFFNLVINGSANNGAPREFWPEGPVGRIYWSPTPDAVYTIRGYGLWAKADYAAAANTFLYPDDVALGLAPIAVEAFRLGLDRETTWLQSRSQYYCDLARKALTKHSPTGPESRVYMEPHDA